MLNSVDFSGKPFHFIGIGGIGMSALAYVLVKRKLPVSGSDIRLSHITQRLQTLGAHIFWSQDATNLEYFQQALNSSKSQDTQTLTPTAIDPDVLPQVICSTAINTSNSEYRAALELGCPIYHRSDVLAALIQEQRSIAVAGTHGKTTTSSLIGYLLLQAGLDPTIVVGGEVNSWEGNARAGEGEYLVAEADESDGSLVKFSPEIGIITNIELDHPDHYTTLDQVIETFQVFARQCKKVVGCIDCELVRDRIQPEITYSLRRDSQADYTVDFAAYGAEGTTARVWEKGKLLGNLSIRLLGQHNLSNALAAVAVGRDLGLDFATISCAIATFEGARRRFEWRGTANGIAFIDDYAHHPSEIRATLAAARLSAKNRRVVAIFQPHRYSRTTTLLDEFAQAFAQADCVVVTDIYSAGEPNVDQISGQQVVESIAQHHQQVHYQPTLSAVKQFLTQTLSPGDLALFLGAGNLNSVIPEMIAAYQSADASLPRDGCNLA
ncbi:MAG: UDP-N-acetylmuramate--L-alanine ligase [Desertifilum sp. SIO1I2]|nr:UDP-N-acetylmuramate--L-alanine ligase [Desertifilum sp. SIO1I2]